MSKFFYNSAILTTQNPEAFLCYRADSSDYWIVPSSSIGSGVLYVNGIDIANYETSLGYALKLDTVNSPIAFHVYTDATYKFDTNLRFNFYSTSDLTTCVSTNDVSILNRPFIVQDQAINAYNNDNILIDDEASYLVLRSNPKFTGNIKLRIDSSSKLYLDTFQVSEKLKDKIYRKQQVSAESIFSNDIKNTFSSNKLPVGDLYYINEDELLSISTPKTNYIDQFNMTYSYGARLLKDELYTEDNAILAPLWINSKLPTYFSVFKLDGVYNIETYDDSSINLLADKYLSNSTIIKSWSLKENSPLGKYLNTHINDFKNTPAPVFLSLNNDDPNTWHGINLNSGVISNGTENTYIFDQKSSNFTDLNAWISQGFERNNLLCSNLINIEYLFDDNDAELYKMYRYFGLYLTENILYNIAYYSNSSTGNIEIISLDGKDSSVFFNSSFFDVSGNISDTYKNRLLVLNDGNSLNRITNVNNINDVSFNQYVSKPYKNIFSTFVEKNTYNAFITLTINNPLEQGEHLRIINKTQNKIWEIYGLNTTGVSCDRYCSISEDASGNYPTVCRTYFDVSGNIEYQINEIKNAIYAFKNFEKPVFQPLKVNNNTISIIFTADASIDEEWIFQRITASTLNDYSNPNSGFNNAAHANDITFFGRYTPTSSEFSTIAADASYGPIDFELYGNRQHILVEFINNEFTDNIFYSIDASLSALLEEPTLYQNGDMWYRKLLTFDVSDNYSYLYINDPINDNKILITTEKEIQLVESKFNAYSIYPLNISLMGINPIKDIDYTVYDISLGQKSEYWYKREDDSSTYIISIDSSMIYELNIPGSYVVETGTGCLNTNGSLNCYNDLTSFNTFDSSVTITATTNTIIKYAILDNSISYTSYDGLFNEENISDYYDSSTMLKKGRSLTVPLVSKWVSIGKDCRNNQLRLMLNTSTNFVVDSSNYSQEISYPSFKYLNSGTDAWKSYTFYDINDVVFDGSVYKTFKEMMFEHPTVDYFSKLVYSNYNVDKTYTRSSIVYYNDYKEAVDVIITGVNFSLAIKDIAKNILNIKDYNKYRFSFISSPSRNKDDKHPIELIINENTKTILLIWYQGNDVLNYNMRYSSYLPGKSILDINNKGFINGKTTIYSKYSYVKTPFVVNTSLTGKTLVDQYYGNNSAYTNDMARQYAQLNKNLNGFKSILNAFSNNNKLISFSQINFTNSYDTFSQYINYTYNSNINTYGDYVINYGYKYLSNKNFYINNTTNINTLKLLLSTSKNNLMCYIIRENDILSNENFNASPLTITINTPKLYNNVSTYNGWFKPKFNNILNFKANEDINLINTVQKDFIFSNTNLQNYNDIKQLWYNKLVSSVSEEDVSTGNAISYLNAFNVFKSLWDANYFIKDNADIHGYNSPDEIPSYFGSKLIKLPNILTLDDWVDSGTSINETDSDINITFNITRAIINKFKANDVFLSNWESFSNGVLIDSYIKTTILSYYNLITDKIQIEYYTMPYSSQRFYYQYDSNFILNNNQNFKADLSYINNEFIYKMVISKDGNYSYYAKIILTEK